MVAITLNKVSSRLNFHKAYTPNFEHECSTVGEFVTKDSILAAASDRHSDNVLFTLADKVKTLDKPIANGYGNLEAPRQLSFGVYSK